MKKYTAPNMTVSKFMTENIITTSGGDTGLPTAEQSVQEKMQNNSKSYAAVTTFKFTL